MLKAGPQLLELADWGEDKFIPAQHANRVVGLHVKFNRGERTVHSLSTRVHRLRIQRLPRHLVLVDVDVAIVVRAFVQLVVHLEATRLLDYSA